MGKIRPKPPVRTWVWHLLPRDLKECSLDKTKSAYFYRVVPLNFYCCGPHTYGSRNATIFSYYPDQYSTCL